MKENNFNENNLDEDISDGFQQKKNEDIPAVHPQAQEEQVASDAEKQPSFSTAFQLPEPIKEEAPVTDVFSENVESKPQQGAVQNIPDAFSAQQSSQQAAQPSAPPTYQPLQGSQVPHSNYQPNVPPAPHNPYAARPAVNQNQGYYGSNGYQRPGGYYQQNTPVRPPQPSQPLQQPPEKKGGKAVAAALILICIIVAVVSIAIGMVNFDTMLNSADQTTTSQQDNNQATTNKTPDVTVSDSMDVSTTNPSSDVPNSVYVADKVRPSVVGVMIYYDGVLSGEGSGVLMSEKDGWTYVVTCAHVISEEGVEYGILLLDGTTIEAELVAYDERTDIGVIKVNKTGLPLAEFGDSSTLRIGEPIYAVGNPGGAEYFGSITDGIVASIDRSVTSTYTMTCIQHNAAINPGNSGGALVNASGQVVGINSSKIAGTEYEGMGFAVPTSIAGPIVDSLINYGYVPNRPKLGIEYAPVSSYQLYSIIVSVKGLPQGSLVIASIADDSSLIGTDAQVGDMIIGVNGKDMDNASVLLDLIETGAVGDTLTLNLCRVDKRTYKVTTFDVVITLVEDRGSN